MINDDSTVKEVKDFLRENLLTGTECPCCKQRVQMYERQITSSMGYVLILVYKYHNDGEFFHLEDFLKSIDCPSSFRGDATKLRYWHLMEQDSQTQIGGTRSGLWRITQGGRDFVERKKKVLKYARIYYGNFYGHSGPPVSIDECLAKKFDLEELLGGVKKEV